METDRLTEAERDTEIETANKRKVRMDRQTDRQTELLVALTPFRIISLKKVLLPCPYDVT